MCSASPSSPVIVVASIGAQDIRYRPGGGCRFYNPGDESDAKVLGESLDCQGNLRAIGEKLHDLYRDKKRERSTDLRFPILAPALRYVINKLAGDAIEQLLLVVTDQDADVGHRDKDTVFCGYLVERLVADSWSDARIKNVRFLEIEKAPHKADVMYRKMREELIKLDRDFDRLYVITTAGTPQINDGLRHGGINVFGNRCNVIQVDRPERDPDGAAEGEVRSVPLAPYFKDAIRRGAQALVDHDNFAGALDLLREFSMRDWPPVLFSLLEYAQARFNLDMHVAGNHARSVRDEFERTPDVVSDTGIQDYLRVLRGPAIDPFGRVNEVRFLVDSALRNGRYADALFRVALFQESSESILSVAALGLRVEEYANRPLPHGIVAELDQELAEIGADRRGRHWSLISRKDRQSVLNFALQLKTEEVWRETARMLCGPVFQKLVRLRNDVIHKAAGVSRNTISEIVTPAKLTGCLRDIANGLAQCLGRNMPDDPYPRLRTAIHAVLRA